MHHFWAQVRLDTAVRFAVYEAWHADGHGSDSSERDPHNDIGATG